MYEELLAKIYDLIPERREASQYYTARVLQESADAIENLIKRLDGSIPKGDAEIIIAELAKPTQASKCPHYIRNVHDRGDDSLCDKYKCEVNALPKWIPATERLPEEEESVFVVRKFLGIKGQVPPSTYTEIAYRIGDIWLADSDEYKIARHKHTDPLYWMPIPEPPKED